MDRPELLRTRTSGSPIILAQVSFGWRSPPRSCRDQLFPPVSLMNKRFINCEVCQTEGRIYTCDGNNPDWTDHGICPECNGECVVEIETFPIEMEDLDET
jgi:hypothetical protein